MVKLIVGKVVELDSGTCDWCCLTTSKKELFKSVEPIFYGYHDTRTEFKLIKEHEGYSHFGNDCWGEKKWADVVIKKEWETLKKYSGICRDCVKQLAADKS